MSTPGNAPMGEAEYQRLIAGIESARVALSQIDMAKQAGIDVGAREQGAKDTLAGLVRIKNTYFPGR